VLEIGYFLITTVGTLVAVLVVAVILTALLGFSGPEWDAVGRIGRPVLLVAAAVSAVWRLVGVRRR
jgi:hypothetical protein